MVVMIEPPDTSLSPLSTPEQVIKSTKLVRRDCRGIPSPSEVENGGEERHGRSTKSHGDPQASMDTESEVPESRKKPSHMRFKPVELHSSMQSPSDCERKFQRKKPQSSQISKTNAQYHKLFKEIGKDEILKQSYTCALQKDILYQGKMFVSDNWICFHSKVFGRDTKIAIPVLSVTLIKKTKTAILVPNALVIATSTERHVFVSFLSRDTTYKILKSVCVHLDDTVCSNVQNNAEHFKMVDNTGNSPIISSCENSFRVAGPSSLPLEFCDDLSDLDGVLRQRRQDLLESSSSGSQTPDYEKMTDFSSLPETFLSAVKSGEVSVHADIHLQNQSQKHGASSQNGQTKLSQGVAHKDTSPQNFSLHNILFIYLFLVGVLVLSSCYMAIKIVALEQRLNTLVSVGEYVRNENIVTYRSQSDFNADMYGELSTNLIKLEKIQRNLRKLLEET